MTPNGKNTPALKESVDFSVAFRDLYKSKIEGDDISQAMKNLKSQIINALKEKKYREAVFAQLRKKIVLIKTALEYDGAEVSIKNGKIIIWNGDKEALTLEYKSGKLEVSGNLTQLRENVVVATKERAAELKARMSSSASPTSPTTPTPSPPPTPASPTPVAPASAPKERYSVNGYPAIPSAAGITALGKSTRVSHLKAQVGSNNDAVLKLEFKKNELLAKKLKGTIFTFNNDRKSVLIAAPEIKRKKVRFVLKDSDGDSKFTDFNVTGTNKLEMTILKKNRETYTTTIEKRSDGLYKDGEKKISFQKQATDTPSKEPLSQEDFAKLKKTYQDVGEKDIRGIRNHLNLVNNLLGRSLTPEQGSELRIQKYWCLINLVRNLVGSQSHELPNKPSKKQSQLKEALSIYSEQKIVQAQLNQALNSSK